MDKTETVLDKKKPVLDEKETVSDEEEPACIDLNSIEAINSHFEALEKFFDQFKKDSLNLFPENES